MHSEIIRRVILMENKACDGDQMPLIDNCLFICQRWWNDSFIVDLSTSLRMAIRRQNESNIRCHLDITISEIKQIYYHVPLKELLTEIRHYPDAPNSLSKIKNIFSFIEGDSIPNSSNSTIITTIGQQKRVQRIKRLSHVVIIEAVSVVNCGFR